MLSTRGVINSLAKKTTQEEKKNLKNILIKRKKAGLQKEGGGKVFEKKQFFAIFEFFH